MASAQDITQKIQSLANIQKVTGAMNLIASLRFRKLVSRQKALEAFERGLDDWAAAVLPGLLREDVPLAARGHSPVTLAVVFTADRGLCGSHNHSVQKMLDSLAETVRAEGRPFEAACLGTRGAAAARRGGYPVVWQRGMKGLTPESAEIGTLGAVLWTRFIEGRAGSVVLVYNRFVSALRQVGQTETLLPLGLRVDGAAPAEPSFEPGVERFAAEAGPLWVRYRLAAALTHSMLSEHAARMTAMDNASKNARDLTNRAIKERNRVRQAGITGELIEIISGKEAMKRRTT